jgi:L-lactate dehydrogenase complex protein LldG
MTAREEILNKVRQRRPPVLEAAESPVDGITYADPAQQFASVLASVGGRCLCVADRAAAQRELANIGEYASARRRVSTVSGVGNSTLDLQAVTDPHQVEDVEFAVLPGELAVAENAAVWVATDSVIERTLYFLSQHVALVVPSERIVNNLHEAYSSLDVARCRFGTFVSGPSKTADIEQSLVIGAHGARSLTVFLVGS